MRRSIPLLLFVIVLVLPFALRLMLRAGAPVLESSDPDAGTLVIVTPHNQDIRREFAAAFDAWHRQIYGRGVRIDYRTPGGTNDIKRLLETTYRGYQELGREPEASIDVVWGGGDYFFDVELKPLGLLQPLGIDAAVLNAAIPETTLAGVKLYDASRDPHGEAAAPTWVGVCLSSFGIVYNPDLYAALDLSAPRQWRDLADPALVGAVALADPTHSGSAAVAYMMVVQRAMADAETAFLQQHASLADRPRSQWAKDPGYSAALAVGWHRGMGQLLLMAANARYFTDSASQVPNDVSTGDAAAGVAIDFYARVTEEAVGSQRVRFVSPAGATAITPDPVGILAGVKGDSLVLARHFVEFLLSPQAQRLWILKVGQPGGPIERALRRTPIRRDIYGDQAGWSDEVNPFEEAHGFNQRGEWMVLFADTRPIWGAAWLDGREALKSAYRQVLSVREPSARAALLAQLADLPISMEEVAQLRNQRRELEKSGADIEQWKARMRIELAGRFRAHYQKVAAAAKHVEDSP